MQHPLFPDHEDDGRELGFIRVYRHLPDGTRNLAPQSFGPDELSDIDVFFDLFGGGKYEVVAHAGDGKIITRNRLSFEGRPKPLNGDAPERGESAPPQAGQPQDGGSPWAMMMTFLQMQMQMAQVQSKQQTELMLALLGRGDQNSAQHVATMQALHDRFAQSQTQLLGMILQTGKSGEGGSEAFMKGVEWAQEFARGAAEAAEESDGDDLMSTIGQFVGAMKEARPVAQAAVGAGPPQQPQQQPQQPPKQGPNGASS
jgi:hypothetical protein